MTVTTTRTPPQIARFSRPSTDRSATIDTMIAHTAAFGIGGWVSTLATDIAPADPAPAAPNTPSYAAARLDTQIAQIRDHEEHLATLEERLPPPPVDTGAQAAPSGLSTVAISPATQMVNDSGLTLG